MNQSKAKEGTTTNGKIFALTSLLHNKTNAWIIDSGATDHMINDKSKMKTFSIGHKMIAIADGKEISSEGSGMIELFGQPCSSKALFIPKFASNMLSVGKVAKDLNCFVIFGPNLFVFQDICTRKKIGEGCVQNGLYVVDDSKQALNVTIDQEGYRIWHARLGHPSVQALKLLFPSIKNNDFLDNCCEACKFGKQSRNQFNLSENEYRKPFELIHSDVWTSPIASKYNYKYYITFIDHKTRF